MLKKKTFDAAPPPPTSAPPHSAIVWVHSPYGPLLCAQGWVRRDKQGNDACRGPIAYWFLKTWGHKLQGVTLVCHTDNTATEGMLKKMTGTSTCISLLKEIRLLLVKYDIKLAPVHITSKDNLMSDCLSRGAMAEFLQALQRWAGGPNLASDREDWQLKPVIVHEDLENEFGLFDMDACTEQHRTNAHCANSWNEEDDCTKQEWGGLHTFCNGPFSLLFDILKHFVECKERHPVGTAAVFIVPLWPTEQF
eukprot:1193424-Prorocentrum_minimum.AAC.4